MGWRSYGYGYGYGFRSYESVASRRANAAREVAKLKKAGRELSPINLPGSKIATTFWGKAWCTNLESYSDYANRLPRGRSYVRNGSVVDLQIDDGRVNAIVSGSELYDVKIAIKKLPAGSWENLKRECGGKIGSLVELLQGRLSQSVMELVTRRDAGLFPRPAEIEMNCSCPDAAYMCKHIAAVLYGVGARLDQHPELLFMLRNVDHLELIAGAGAPPIAPSAAQPTIAAADLADVFGIDLDAPASLPNVVAPPPAKVAKAQKPPLASPKKKVQEKVRRVRPKVKKVRSA